MLTRYKSNAGVFELVDSKHRRFADSNTYTVIVGKNGTGKSRLLRAIVRNLLRDEVDPATFERELRVNTYSDEVGHLDFERAPKKIICVSTSPFDKFPLPRRQFPTPFYSYLGLRGLPSQNLGVAYMGRVMSTLLEAAENKPSQSEAIADVLEYLGYEGVISSTFALGPSVLIQELAGSKNPREALERYLQRPPPFSHDAGYHMWHLLKAKPDQLRRVVRLAAKMLEIIGKPRLDISLSRYGIEVQSHPELDRKEVVTLARCGLLRLREVIFKKKNSYDIVKIGDFSSGEQSVVMGLLGIGSQICDDALICIDEPEVCLHPEWQERYIELLFNTFKNYKGCHFIIATHSPQIVAQLPEGDCHVMRMENGLAWSSGRYSGRSIDFQLAEVFKAPGFRNEYLNRVALNLFARISKTKKFDEANLVDLRSLESASTLLRREDPLLELIAALRQMHGTYGGHN